jgi:hypothetical protein
VDCVVDVVRGRGLAEFGEGEFADHFVEAANATVAHVSSVFQFRGLEIGG